MASFIKKLFGSSSNKFEPKQEVRLPKPETPERIQYWDKEIENIIPQDVINRGIIESAYNGTPVHQGMLGLAFLPFSRDHAKTWLSKAAEMNDRYSKEVLNEVNKEDSDEYLMIWWGLRDFSNVIGNRKVNILNRATDPYLNKVVFRNAILVPFFEDVTNHNCSFDYFEYIRDHIDQSIIPNTEIICKSLENEGDPEAGAAGDSADLIDFDELFDPANHVPQENRVKEDSKEEFDVDKFFSDDTDDNSGSSGESFAKSFKARLKKQK